MGSSAAAEMRNEEAVASNAEEEVANGQVGVVN